MVASVLQEAPPYRDSEGYGPGIWIILATPIVVVAAALLAVWWDHRRREHQTPTYHRRD